MDDLGKTNDEAEYNAALVESNGRIYCAIPVDHDATHPVEDILKTRPNCLVEQEATIIQYKPWDKQAKFIDKVALILMPSLFLMVATIYWSTYLHMGYVLKTGYSIPNYKSNISCIFLYDNLLSIYYLLLFQTKLSIKICTSEHNTNFERYNEFDHCKFLNIVSLTSTLTETVYWTNRSLHYFDDTNAFADKNM